MSDGKSAPMQAVVLPADNRFTDLHPLAISGEMPQEITSLVGRCEINEDTFSNDDLSLALKFGEMVWRRLLRMAEHYERQSKHFMPGDSRDAGPGLGHRVGLYGNR